MQSSSRVVLVTGGAQGIGKGVVQHFNSRGWQVGFVDSDDEAGRETASEVQGARFWHGDVADAELARRVASECRESLDRFRRVLEINLVAQYIWAQALVPSLREGRGAIVNIASTRALQSEPNG